MIGLILIILFVFPLGLFYALLPLINRSSISDIQRQIAEIQKKVDSSGSSKNPSAVTQNDEHPDAETIDYIEAISPTNQVDSPRVTAPPTPDQKSANLRFEQTVTANLPVWIGGIALAFAGFYLVKYSIDHGLLHPVTRVVLGAVFGCGLLLTSNWAQENPKRFSNKRIPQALAGAGICVLYGVVYSANQLYNLIDSLTAFAGFVTITAIAIRLSLRFGSPIAFMGLIGGFVAPGIVGQSEPNAMLMFGYLYMLFLGITETLKKNLRWAFSLTALVCSYAWVIIWSELFLRPGDSVWISLFLVALSVTVFVRGHKTINHETTAPSNQKNGLLLVNWLALGGTLFLALTLAAKSEFALTERLLIGALGAGSIILAAISEKLYGFTPLITMGVTFVSLVMWGVKDPWLFMCVWASYFTLYAGAGYGLLLRSTKPLVWVILVNVTVFAFTLLGYVKLRNTPSFNDPVYWGMAALLFASASLYILQYVRRNFDNSFVSHRMQGVCAITATSLISFSLGINVAYKFLGIAIAGEIFALAWIYTRIHLTEIRVLIRVLVLGLLGYLILGTSYVSGTIVQFIYFYAMGNIVLNDSLWNACIHLGIPGALLVGARYFIHQKLDAEKHPEILFFETFGLALLYIAGVSALNGLFGDANVSLPRSHQYILHHLIITFTLVISLVSVIAARHIAWIKTSIHQAKGYFILGICMLFPVQFSYFIIPYAHTSIVGGTVFNSLLIGYLFPAVVTWFIGNAFADLKIKPFNEIARGMTLVSSFLWVTLNVNYFFQGNKISFTSLTNAEIYTYSVVWLLYGIALLAWSIQTKDKHARMGSFFLLVLVVLKVFLYDASNLDGLYRVMSFLGLGVILMGLGWFSSQFIFVKPQKSLSETPEY